MCNVNCFKWIAQNLSFWEVVNKRVLDVGSYDVNGSLRYVFEMLEPDEYVGTDIVEGPGVDVVCPAQELVKQFGQERFDIVVSASMLEHTQDWRTAVSNMKRVCKKGGLIFLIVPSSWRRHEHPHDYWRFPKSKVEAMFSDCIILNFEEDEPPDYPIPNTLVYLKAWKPSDFVEADLSFLELPKAPEKIE